MTDLLSAGQSTAPQIIDLSSEVLIQVVRETLTPEQSESTKKALDNSKIRTRMNKQCAEILTEEKVLKDLKAKNDSKKQSKKRPISEKDQPSITKYLKGTTKSGTTKSQPKRTARVKSKSSYIEDSDSGSIDSPDTEDSEGLFIPRTASEIKKELYKFWKTLSPPHKESDIIGKWYAAIYMDSKGKPLLNIGRATLRLLDDEASAGGKCTDVQLNCLKPHVGNTLSMEEYPEGQVDQELFKIYNIIAGPVTMEPRPNRKWHIPHLMDLKTIYNNVVKVDRQALYLKM